MGEWGASLRLCDEEVIAKTETGVSLPLEKNEFGAEGRPHGAHHAVAAGASGAVVKVFLHDSKDGDGGEVSALTEAVP